MGIDIEKFRMTSSFRKTTGDYKIRESTVQQLIAEFDLYQEYAPNTHIIYINDDPTPVLATFQDVSDLEIRTDSKWMLTSLRHKVYCGDIFMLEGKKWMCIYDKEKNTSSCYKVKVQPCNYQIKIPLFKSDATPFYL